MKMDQAGWNGMPGIAALHSTANFPHSLCFTFYSAGINPSPTNFAGSKPLRAPNNVAPPLQEGSVQIMLHALPFLHTKV
jgi:hypothetical protein